MTAPREQAGAALPAALERALAGLDLGVLDRADILPALRATVGAVWPAVLAELGEEAGWEGMQNLLVKLARDEYPENARHGNGLADTLVTALRPHWSAFAARVLAAELRAEGLREAMDEVFELCHAEYADPPGDPPIVAGCEQIVLVADAALAAAPPVPDALAPLRELVAAAWPMLWPDPPAHSTLQRLIDARRAVLNAHPYLGRK